MVPVLTLLAAYTHSHVRAWISIKRGGRSLVGLDSLLALSKWSRVLNCVRSVALRSCFLVGFMVTATHRLRSIALARASDANVDFTRSQLAVVIGCISHLLLNYVLLTRALVEKLVGSLNVVLHHASILFLELLANITIHG